MTSSHTQNITPTSYDEVFRHYYPMILGLVKKFGILPEQREDVAMTILAKFIEHDALNDFDPKRIGGNGSPMRFQSFLSGFVVSYIRWHVEKQALLRKRELTLVDQPLSEHGRSEENVGDSNISWLDLRMQHEDHHEYLEAQEALNTVRTHLKKLPVTKGQGDLLTLLDLIQLQMKEVGKISATELAELYGVSSVSVRSWMSKLKSQATVALQAS
jgi:hypothetical protein